MAFETLADKLTKKTFNSPDFQKTWGVHMQAFGPILEPAFREDYQSRIHLTAALNQISNRNVSQGLKKLQSIQNKCRNDADKAALLFFMGLGFEMAGQRDQMLECYTYANEYAHGFYLPYLKVAKFYLNGCMYDRAAKEFPRAIACFDATGLDDQSRVILGSAYTNYATCLLMMHRYEEAEAAITTSKTLYPEAPGRFAVEMPLYALRDDREEAERCLAALKEHSPDAYDSLKETAERILSHSDPHFFPVEVEAEKVAAFWTWFSGKEGELFAMLEREQYEAAVDLVAEELLKAFPFLEEPPYVALGKNEEGYILELQDMYAVAIENAYGILMQNRPETVASEKIRFAVVH